jgi:anti-anti-sigma factor
MELRCTLRRYKGTDVLTLVGDIDWDGKGELRRVAHALDGPRVPVRVDMTRVAFMDSTGAHFLTALKQRTTAAGVSLSVQGTPRQPTRVLELLRLTDLISEQPR